MDANALAAGSGTDVIGAVRGDCRPGVVAGDERGPRRHAARLPARPSPGDLDLSVEVHGGVAVLTPAGEVDLLTAPALHEQLRMRTGLHRRVVLDLSEVRFISIAGVRAVVEAHLHARTVGGALHVTGTEGRCVRRVLTLSRVDRILLLSTRPAPALAAELNAELAPAR